VGVCKQSTCPIPYYSIPRLVTLLKFLDASSQDSNILVLPFCVKFINFTFQIFRLLFFLKCVLFSCLTVFLLCALLWFWSCNHCSLACFHSHWPRLYLAEIWYSFNIFSSSVCVFVNI
jgi:hypothetical protein